MIKLSLQWWFSSFFSFSRNLIRIYLLIWTRSMSIRAFEHLKASKSHTMTSEQFNDFVTLVIRLSFFIQFEIYFLFIFIKFCAPPSWFDFQWIENMKIFEIIMKSQLIWSSVFGLRTPVFHIHQSQNGFLLGKIRACIIICPCDHHRDRVQSVHIHRVHREGQKDHISINNIN